MKMREMPLVSVIVPVYGTEKYLRKCLDSILKQTYRNLQIIIVNDASKDNAEEIINEYLGRFENIKYVCHSQNRGLFRARISGAEEADGEYIAFVDSDDYLSCDYYRLLVKKAEETQADMAIGTWCYEYDDGRREYCNLDPTLLDDINVEGEDVLRTYMEQKGLCFSWQLCWNKIYRKSLWDGGYEEFVAFSDANPGLTMCEDIAFSAYFWTHAHRVVNVKNAMYFYCRRKNASTGQNTTKVQQNKYLNDTISVFGFLKTQLLRVGKYEQFIFEYQEWVKLYGRINFDKYKNGDASQEELQLLKRELFLGEDFRELSFDDNFFYSIKTPLAPAWQWYQDIKQGIMSENCQIVSFDIFDTLLVRPFWIPTDLFYMMNPYFVKITDAESDIDFAQMRIESERSCRERMRAAYPLCDDITLSEIYEEMHNRYSISQEILKKMREKEIEYELRFCTSRVSGKELYDLACYLGKTVVFTSDMYLEETVVKMILQKNGYAADKTYLSSATRQGKWSGRLYQYLLKDLQVEEPETVCHIGDNWSSDVEMPRKYGIRSFHLCKPVDMMQNLNPSIYSGEAYTQSFDGNATGRDLRSAIWGFAGLRTMLAVVANKIFDNPYVSFHKASDFNANPVFVGYFALGMHVFAVVKWLIEKTKGKQIGTIHFVARDGFLVKRVYDLINKDAQFPVSNYLHLSRKALALADVKRPVDIYSLITKLNIHNSSPERFLRMFDGIIQERWMKEFRKTVKEKLYPYSSSLNDFFRSRNDYEKFVKIFIDELWDKADFSEYQKKLRAYFGKILTKGDVLFDIGYSGRAENALKSIMGYTLNSYYIHSNSQILDTRKLQCGFENELFYNYKPNITGVMREHMFMKLAPSTIGYHEASKGNVVPLFEEYHVDYQTQKVTEQVQNAAYEFAKDMTQIFGELLPFLHFRREDASQPFEYYLNYGKKLDRSIFSSVIFEDDFGEGKKLRAVDFWGKEIERTLNLQRPIALPERILSENEYVGVSQIRKYKMSRRQRVSTGKSLKTAMFLDRMASDDDINVLFSKVADNTDNLIPWEALECMLCPTVIQNWYMTHPGGFDENKYDVYLSTHLNLIQQNTDLTWLNDVLRRIGDKPLLPVGIGFSKEGMDGAKDFKLDSASVKTLAAIAERCVSVGVKGEYSAEILAKYGIKNSVIIGCPSMYLDVAKLKKISVEDKTLEKLSSAFKPIWGKFSDAERELLEFFQDNNFSLTASTKMELAPENIDNEKLFVKLKRYEQDRQIYFSASEWNKSFEGVDFAMGMDFYHNVAALQAGVPALFVTYETTGRELCRFFKLPCIDISEFDSRKTVKDYYRMADYSLFKASIDDNYRKFIDFLTANGVKVHSVNSRVIKK